MTWPVTRTRGGGVGGGEVDVLEDVMMRSGRTNSFAATEASRAYDSTIAASAIAARCCRPVRSLQ